MKAVSAMLLAGLMSLSIVAAAMAAPQALANGDMVRADPKSSDEVLSAPLLADHRSQWAATDGPMRSTDTGTAAPVRPRFRPILEPHPGEHGMAPQKIQDTDGPALPRGKSSMNKGVIDGGLPGAAGNGVSGQVGGNLL